MKNRIIVIPKRKLVLFALIIAAIIFAASVVCNFHDHKVISEFSTFVWKMEPETPQNIDDPPFGELPSSNNDCICQGSDKKRERDTFAVCLQ